jgi:hypothetical protein
VSVRTIIEINHDYLDEASGVLQDLLMALPHASESEIKEELRKTNSVRFVTQRPHWQKVTVEIE